ncbi:hypothetical protein D3C77_626170 [compost metagenome]
MPLAATAVNTADQPYGAKLATEPSPKFCVLNWVEISATAVSAGTTSLNTVIAVLVLTNSFTPQ